MNISRRQRGLSLPFRRDGKNDFASATGMDLLRSKVEMLLCTALGELPWRTGFGTGLAMLRHRASGAALEELCRIRVRDALRTWMPSVELVSLAVNRDASSGMLILRVKVREGVSEASAEVAPWA